MKNSKSIFKMRIALMVLFTMSISLQLKAQSNKSPEAMITGNWVFSEGPSYANMPQDIKQQLDSIPSLKQEIFSAYGGRKMFFNPNGEFIQTIAQGIRITGRWALQGNTLLITDPEGNVYTMELAELKQNRLSFITPTAQGTRPMIPIQYYSKTN